MSNKIISFFNTFALLSKGPVTQRKRMNQARITHRFSLLRGACVVCVIRRWIERGPSVIVSGCAWKAGCAWFWVLNGSKKMPVCVIHGSACVVYASSMRDYARDTRRPSVLMRRNWFKTAYVHVRPLTPPLHITAHVSRSSRNESACTRNVR